MAIGGCCGCWGPLGGIPCPCGPGPLLPNCPGPLPPKLLCCGMPPPLLPKPLLPPPLLPKPLLFCWFGGARPKPPPEFDDPDGGRYVFSRRPHVAATIRDAKMN